MKTKERNYYNITLKDNVLTITKRFVDFEKKKAEYTHSASINMSEREYSINEYLIIVKEIINKMQE